MKNNAMHKGIHNPDEINQFFEDWRAHGLTRIDEWVSPETTHRALIENVWRGTEYYHHWTEEGPSGCKASRFSHNIGPCETSQGPFS